MNEGMMNCIKGAVWNGGNVGKTKSISTWKRQEGRRNGMMMGWTKDGNKTPYKEEK
jgi:hypothetical protein